jgi:hypothetical protein
VCPATIRVPSARANVIGRFGDGDVVVEVEEGEFISAEMTRSGPNLVVVPMAASWEWGGGDPRSAGR